MRVVRDDVLNVSSDGDGEDSVALDLGFGPTPANQMLESLV